MGQLSYFEFRHDKVILIQYINLNIYDCEWCHFHSKYQKKYFIQKLINQAYLIITSDYFKWIEFELKFDESKKWWIEFELKFDELIKGWIEFELKFDELKRYELNLNWNVMIWNNDELNLNWIREFSKWIEFELSLSEFAQLWYGLTCTVRNSRFDE